MQPYELTAPAQEDLKEIARYTVTEWGEKQSLHYAESLENVSVRSRLEQPIHARFQSATRKS